MKKHRVIKNVLNKQALEIVKTSLLLIKDMNYYFDKVDSSDKNYFADGQPVSSNCWHNYGAAVTDSLLLTIQPLIEKEFDVKLYPTYSFSRIYWSGSSMVKHIDRQACEYSVSLCLDVDPDPWGIWFEGEEIILHPGDLVAYKGMEVEHWRETYTGKQQIQTFLHYVDRNGPYSSCKYDGREILGV